MKKKYLYNGEYYTESEMNDFAKQSGVSFDSYIAALGKDVKVLDAPYEYKGNFYTQDEISAAAKKKGINDDAYLSQNGIKKKEEAYTGGAMSSAASKIGGQVGNFVGQSEKDNALSLIQSINAGITKGIEKGKQQFPNEIRATPEEEAALRDAQRRTGQADGLFTQQGAEQFNLLATDPLRAILDPEREKLQTAYNNRRLQGVRQTSDNTIARNNIDPNKTVQKKDGKLIPDVSSNPEYQVKNQEQALENVSGLVKNKFFKNGKEALEYAENQVKSGIDPTGNETIEHAITKAGEYKQKEESALNGKSIIQNAIEIQLQNDPLFKKQYETIINGTASDAEIADVARRFNIPLDKLKTQGSLPQEVVGELVHRFISDPDIKQIAEDNPEFKKDFDNFTGDKIYEVFPEYADVYIKNTLSRARELDGKNNWFANPIFDKSKYMDNLAEEVFKDRPILLKRVKDKFHNNWEHKIETTGIVDDLATGARGAMSGMWRSLKDVSGFGESYSDRIRNTLKEQYGHVETPHQNEFRKVVGEASNFMGMVLAMGATGSGLGNIGKGLGVMNPSVASKAVTLATFFDDELNHAASIYPENPTKAYLRASLSTAFFLVAGDAIPASKITGFKQNITQTLKSLETKALDKQAKMKLRDKILSVATETLQGTAKGTAEMTVMINGFKLLIDRALGLDESSINNEYSDANLLATAKSMLFGLPVPSMIHGFKGINRTRAAIYEMASNPEKYKSAILKRFGSDDHRIADIDFIADFKKYLDSMRVAENEKAKMVFNALHAKRLREQKSPDAFMKRNHEEEIRAIEQEQQDIMDGKDSDAGLTDSQKAIKTAYENGEINEMMEAQIKEALKDPAKADQFIKEIAEQATGAVAPELGNAKDGAIKFFGETLTDFAIGKSGKKGGGESVVFEYENEGEVPQKLKPLMVKDENGRITITMPKDEADALQKRIAEGLEPDMELMDGTLIKKADIKIKDVQDGRVKYKGEEGTIYQDGQTLVFKVDGKEKEYELGNVNDISDKPISELGIEQVGQKEVSVVSVADNGNVVEVIYDSESLLSKEQTPPALRDVESTAKALDGSSLKGIVFADKNGVEKIVVQDNKGGGFLIKNNDGKPQNPTMGNHKDISEAYHKAKSDGSNPELVKAVEELLTPSINEKANDKKPDTERTKEEPKVSPADTKVEQPKKGFTESKDLNKMFADLKSKYGDKKGSALYEAANRLVNPNENTIAEIRSNGVVVKEGDKYTLKPFGNTDASPNKWTLYKGLDVTDQFQKSVEQQPIVDSNSEVDALKDVESTAKALEGIDESQLPEVIDKESYLAKNGAPFMGGAEPALHKNIQEGRAKQQMIKRVSDEMNKNNQKREELRKEYEQKVKEGKILPPNRNDKLIASANSNPDLESTQAARRLLEKKGIDWQIGKTKPQSISEAYHKAKADGTNPELVKAVEELLGKPTEKPKTETTPNVEDKQTSKKQQQLEIINKTNPAPNDYNLWVRKVDDIKTAEEAFKNAREDGAMFDDFGIDDMQKAIETGEVTVYSSYPIENGVFVSPSRQNAQEYAGGKGGKLYSKKVSINDIAWLDEGDGQYAQVKAVEEALSKPNTNETTPENKKVEGNSALRDVESEKKQIEDFGVAKEDVEATHGLLGRVFDGLKKAGLTAAKNVGEWVGIGKGTEKPYTLKINGKDTQVKNVSPEVVNGFYSPLEKIITESKFDKLPAKQWAEKYANSEEAKWTGLKDWLAKQQGSVSKADIQQFLKDNRIQVVEVVKSDRPFKQIKQAFEKVGNEWEEVYGGVFAKLSDKSNEYERRYNLRINGVEYGRDFTYLDAKSYIEANAETNPEKQRSKFSQYQLEGQKENYKEVLVTLPAKPLTFEEYKTEAARGGVVFGSEERARESYNEYLEAPGNDISKSENFSSNHFSEKNILVHLRMNTRTDAEGNKVLFLEEVQSDWGQKGKKEGFVEKVDKNNIQNVREDENVWVVKFDDGSFLDISKKEAKNAEEAKILALQSKKERFVSNDAKTPTAPFVTDTNAWTKLGLKVALKEAVKQGADKIAWSTGTQQFERWGSEEIHWEKKIDKATAKIEQPNWHKKLSEKFGNNFSVDGVIGVLNMKYNLGKSAEEIANLLNLPKKKGVDYILDNVSLKEWLDISYDFNKAQEYKIQKPYSVADKNFKTKEEAQKYIDETNDFVISVNEQTEGAQAFVGNEEAMREKRLQENNISITTKEQLRQAIENNLSRQRNKSEIDKLTDRIWNRMQTEDSGTSLPRKEGMEEFYGNPKDMERAKDFTVKKEGDVFAVKDEKGKTIRTFKQENEANKFKENYGLGIVGNVAKSLFKQEPKTVSIEGKKNLKNEERIKYLQHFVDELPQLEKTVFENKLSFTEQELDNAIENGSITNESYKQGIRQLKKYEESVAKYNEYKERLDEYNKLKFGTTQHSIDITPELKAAAEKGMPLFQNANAQYRIKAGEHIVEALKDFDGSPKAVTAIVHEFMHPTVVEIFNGAKEGNETGARHANTIVEEYNKANPDKKITLEQMIEGNDAFINGRTIPEYRAVQEFIAEAWEKYHHEGAKGFSKAFQEVLDAITEVFRQVYKSLTGTTLTPELRKMFDELLGKENVSEVVKAPEISSKAKNKFSNLREKIKQKQSLKIVSDEAENRHANSKLTEADNPVQEPNVKALESEGENAKNAAQAENVIIKIDSIISAATDVGLRKVSDISTDEKRFQGRDKLNAEKVQEIAENWKDADQDPIHVWTDPKDGKTYVLSGHHRLAAAKQAGREKVKVIDRSKDFTEEQAIRFAKEEANANRTMETAIERANTLRQKRERGDTKDDINKFLDREGKNKNFVNNLSRLNPKGKTIEALRATEKSDDKVTQKEVEKIADWIGEARDRNKNLTDAHENELFDFLMDREGSKRITTKQDFLSKVNSLAGAMDFNANEPLNIARYKHKTEGEKLYDKEAETQKGKISDLQQRINEINDRIKNPNNPQYLNPDSKDYEEIKKNADNKLSELNTELQAESKALLDLYQQKGKFARQGTEQSSLFSTEKNETELPEDYYNDLRDIIKDLKDEHKGITLDEIKEIAKNELGEYYSEPDIEAAYKMTEPQPPKSAPEPPKSAPSRPDKSVLTNIVNAENTPPEVKKKLTAHGLKYDPESHDEALQIARAVIDSLGIDAAVTEARARNFGGAVNTFIQTEALNALYKKEAQAKTAQEKYEAAEKFAEVSIALDEWARGDAGRGISALATFYQKSPLGMVLKENKSRKEEFNQWAKGKEESWDEFLERLNKTPEFSDYVSEKVQTELREERKKERSKFFKKVDDTLDKWINDLESGNVAFSSVVPPKLIAEALKGVKAAFKVGESATKIIGDAIDYISDKIGDNWDKDTFRAKIEKALNLRAEKTSVDRYADSLKKQIEELQKQIDAGSRNKNQSNKRQLTPEEQSLLDEKKRLQKELNDIDPKTTFAQRIQKQIDDIQRQIDAGKRDEKERKNKKEYSEEEKELQEKLKAKKAELEALSPLKNTESYKLAELDKFREKLKGLSEAEKDEVVSKAYKKLLDNGALDHADLREIIAKATGRGNLTEKQAARLQELNETINAAEIAKQKHLKERTEQTLKEYHKAIDMAAKAKRDLANEFDKKTDYLKVISSSIQGNTLGLLNVAVMNPLYNITTHLALRLPIGTVQSLFGLALGKAEMNTVFGKPMQAEFFGKGGRGFREAFKGLLTGMNKADYESKEIFSSQIRPNRSLRALLGKDNREAKMKLQEKLFHTFSVFPGATAETNFRLLNFGDKPMRYSASAATAAAFAKKYGIKFNTMDWKTFMEFPREIVKEMELAKGKSLKEAEQEAEYVVRSIEKEGERSTMQQDNFFSDMLEKVFSGGKHEGAKSLAKTLTISPFVKIPSNVLWLGYNLVHPQIALAQAAAHTIRSYGYRGKGEIAESKLQMREARYWMSVTMMGAALQAVMIPLIKAGIITAANDEDDSKKKRIADLTYQPQGMFNMTKFWAYLSGKNVNEVQGGFEIPLKYFGLPGALGNSLARDYKQLTPEQKENRRLLTDNLLELFDADDFKDIENGIFSSSSSLLQGLKGGDMTYYAGNMVNLFTNLIQPAAVSEFSRAAIPYRISGKFDSLGDKIKNDLSNRSALFRKLTGKYPKGKRNIWGEIIKKDDSYANRYFGFNNVTKDNFAQFIYEDAQKWDDEDFLPPTVSNSLGGKKLTAEQLDELEENIGLARKEFIRAYTNDIALIEELGKNYSDILGRDAKKAALQYLYQKGRKLGVDMFVSKHPEFENVVSEEEKQVEELLKNFKEINLISEDEINEKIKH